MVLPIPFDSTHYRLVYDVATAGYTDWKFPAEGLVLALVCTVMLVLDRRHPSERWRPVTLMGGIGVGVLTAVTSFCITFEGYRTLRDAERSGKFIVVEGIVRNFQPSDPGDHTDESWDVESNGRVYHFAYVASTLTPGFRNPAVHGGPIQGGLRVRIADVDGYIARLEVAP